MTVSLQSLERGELLARQTDGKIAVDGQRVELVARLHRLDGGCRWSLLPFCAVGTAAGLLLAVRSDYVKVGGITYPRVLLALTPGPVSDGGGYQALWGGRKERRHGTAAEASAVAERPAG